MTALLQTPSPTSEPSFREILEGVATPVLVADAEEVVVYANAAAGEAFDGPLPGRELRELFPQNLRILHGLESAIRLRLSSADETDYEATAAPVGGGHVVISLHAASVEVTADVAVDDLTGLAKRATLMEHLAAAGARPAQAGTCIALHCLDLDRFKLVNDTLGHAVGDLLLGKVADRLRAACRKGDLVARIGGDEFVVLQTDVAGRADAEALSARLVDLVGRTYVLGGHTVNIGASVGLAVQTGARQPRDVLRDADLALYEAKRAGRGRYRVFEAGMDASLHERRELEIDLRRALALKQFDLHYQPFLDLATDTVIGFEALLRWNHPVRGNVPPLRFLPLTEESGLILRLGEWVLRTACKAAAGWPGELLVAVNVSPVQFKSDTLLETIVSALRESGLPAHRLEIEITEGALLDDTDNVLETLLALRKLGVQISMDDFGTGYSSLSYLQKFPFNKIKIDRSFIQGADAGGDSEAILKAVAGLGTSLGMAITAEGVETAAQLKRIREESCTHAQGYFTGRPMEAARIDAFLQSFPRHDGDAHDGQHDVPTGLLQP